MALEPKIAGEKWRRFHRDERVEPRSLIKSNWETSIWYIVYSPEKINPELSAALGEGCGKGGEVSGGSQEGLAMRTQSLTISFFRSQGKVSQPAEATATLSMLGSGQWGENQLARHGGEGDIHPPQMLCFLFYLETCMISQTSSPPPPTPPPPTPDFWFSRLLFLLTIPPLLPKFRAFLYIQCVDCFWWQELSRTCYKNRLFFLEENSLGFEINQGLRSVKK